MILFILSLGRSLTHGRKRLSSGIKGWSIISSTFTWWFSTLIQSKLCTITKKEIKSKTSPEITFQAKLNFQAFLVVFYFISFFPKDGQLWLDLDGKSSWESASNDRPAFYISEESLFLLCVSNLPGDDINKIIICADNTTALYSKRKPLPSRPLWCVKQHCSSSIKFIKIHNNSINFTCHKSVVN